MNVAAKTKIAVILCFAFALIANAQDQLGQKKVLTLAVAKRPAAAAEQQECKVKCGGVIAILDDSGEVKYLDGQIIGAIGFSGGATVAGAKPQAKLAIAGEEASWKM
jgi:uncharacterized protein GlcG (DUF336 family)